MRKMRESKSASTQQLSFILNAPRSQYIQLIIIPIAFTFCGFIGIAVTSAGASLYGSVLWDPLTLIDKWDNRAAAFFAAFAFCLATVGTNISANSLCAGNDMTALWPKVHFGRSARL